MERRASLTELYLHSIPLGVVINNDKKWSEININSTVEEALQVLCREGRSVLPVWNQTSKKYEYCCSRLDIVSMIAWSKDTEWRKSPLIDILETEEHIVDPRIWGYTLADSVINLMEPLSKGVHHVLVKDEDYQETNEIDAEYAPYYFVSQMDILTFLCQNIGRLSAVVDAPIKKIGLLKNTLETLHCVPSTMLAKNAFKKFIIYKCDCLAIVDEKNSCLVSHVTELDILGMGPEAMQFLMQDDYLTIFDFISAIRKENKRNTKPIACTKYSFLKDVMNQMVNNNSGHIFVVDDKDKPVCLLTLSDIICKFSPYDYKYVHTYVYMYMCE